MSSWPNKPNPLPPPGQPQQPPLIDCAKAPTPDPLPQPDDLVQRLINIIHESSRNQSDRLRELTEFVERVEAERATRVQDDRELSSALESEAERKNLQ